MIVVYVIDNIKEVDDKLSNIKWKENKSANTAKHLVNKYNMDYVLKRKGKDKLWNAKIPTLPYTIYYLLLNDF